MLYPFTFKPILKKVIWGGSDICPFKGITPVENGVGESWELSHVEGNYSIVDNGELEGKSLDELIRSYGKELLGEKVMERFGTTFPLLIKCSTLARRNRSRITVSWFRRENMRSY